MKVEEVQKNIEGGMKGIGNFIKRNPFIAIIAVIVVFFLVFLFARPRRREEVTAPQQLPQAQAMPVEVPVPMPVEVPVPKVIEKPIFIEPAVQPEPQIEEVYKEDVAWQEELAAQIDAIHDVLRDDRVEPVVEAVTEPTHEIKFDSEVLDYYADPQKYKREIMREDVIRPPRPRRDDKILTAEGEWEPVESVIARQRERYEDALARDDTKWADIVRRETEIALGHAVDWGKKDKKRAGRFDREKYRQRLRQRARRVR
jgi:hypothetical protein